MAMDEGKLKRRTESYAHMDEPTLTDMDPHAHARDSHIAAAFARNCGRMRKGSIRYVRSFVEKLQAGLSCSKMVKEGHFVVIATRGWKPERFVIDLGYLNNPEFRELLKQAEEEFGFSQEGTIAIPCKPDELQYIICKRG